MAGRDYDATLHMMNTVYWHLQSMKDRGQDGVDLLFDRCQLHTTSLFSPVRPLDFFVCYFLSPFTDRNQQTNRTSLFS